MRPGLSAHAVRRSLRAFDFCWMSSLCSAGIQVRELTWAIAARNASPPTDRATTKRYSEAQHSWLARDPHSPFPGRNGLVAQVQAQRQMARAVRAAQRVVTFASNLAVNEPGVHIPQTITPYASEMLRWAATALYMTVKLCGPRLRASRHAFDGVP